MQIMDSIVEGIYALPDIEMQDEAMLAVTKYLYTGEIPEGISPIINAMIISWAPVLDTSRTKSAAGKRGGKSKSKQNYEECVSASEAETEKSEKCLQKQKQQDTQSCLHNGMEGNGREVKETSPKGEVKKNTRFIPPTPEEVQAYADEKSYIIDPERFCDFYASKGWKVGSSPMKDWRAAVRNWCKRASPSQSLGRTPPHREEIIDEYSLL